MMSIIRRVVPLFVLLLIFSVNETNAQGNLSLSTVIANNGQQMVTFDITAHQAVRLHRFWNTFNIGSGTAEIWARPGGTVNVNTGWQFLGQANFTSTDNTAYTEIPYTLDFPIDANETWGFMIFCSGATTLRYRTGTTPYTFTDSYMTIDTELWGGSGTTNPVAGTTNVSFSFYPRQFCGMVTYDEGGMQPNDAGIAELTSPKNFCPGTHDLKVTLRNFGSNQLTAVAINWTLNGTPQGTINWTGLLDTLTPATRETEITLASSMNFLANTPYTIRAWTSMPNGVPDSSNQNDTLEVTIKAAIEGIYTIGGINPDYATFADAVDDLNENGLCGPVTFNVAAGTYVGGLEINEIAGASATNTVTFDGGMGNASTRVLAYNTSSTNDFVLMLDGADYVRIRNMTIRATGTMYGYGIVFTGGADHNEIVNCNIEVPMSTSAYSIGILASSSSSYTVYGNWGDHNLIQGNTITGGYYGIRWNGSSLLSTTQSVNNQFIENTITDWYYYGMYMYYSAGLKVIRNTAIQRTTGSFLTSAGYSYYIYYPNDGPEISYNYGYASYGPLYIMRPNNYYVSTNNRARIYNNMGGTNGTSTNYGLYVSYPRYTDCVYNTIYMRTTGTAYGLYQYGETGSYDNKFANNYIVLEGNGTFYALYNMGATSGPSHSLFDYNAWYREGSGTDYYYWQGVNYGSVAGLIAGVPGFHQNSVYGEPYFVNPPLDLHSRSMAAYQAGISFPGITDDIDGDPRGVNPCIGADEFPHPPPEFDMSIANVRLDYADVKWARIEDAEHTVSVVLENIGLAAGFSSIDVAYKIGSPPTSSTDGVGQTFSPTWIGQRALLTFDQKISGLSPTSALTVYARVFLPNDGDPSNDVGSDTRRIDERKVYGSEDFNSMLPPSFSDMQGWLDYDWSVANVIGGTTWVTAGNVGVGGSNAVVYPGDMQKADDWLFTPATKLESGGSYRINFQVRSASGAPQTLEVSWGENPNPGAMTTFATFANFTNTTFMSAKELAAGLDSYFNTPVEGSLGDCYIGFRVTSNSGAGQLVLDNIVLDDNPMPPPRVAYAVPGTHITQFIDDASIPISIMVNYKNPGVVNRTYEVASKTNIYGINGDFLWDVETATPWLTITKSIPEPTLQGYNFTPPRPRQHQTFTLSADPSGLGPGVHVGEITFYGILFDNNYPPPSLGYVAMNEPMVVRVEMRIVQGGSKTGPVYLQHEIAAPMTVAGSPYEFKDAASGDPIATLNVTSGQIDYMRIRVYPNQLPQNLARFMYVKRYWQISYVGTGWTADIDFPYTDSEASMIADPFQLRGVRQAVDSGPWEDPIIGTSSVSDPNMYMVRVMDLHPGNIGGNIALAHPYMAPAKPGEAIPTAFALDRNYPNPFGASTGATVTSIGFDVAESRSVRLTVYNSLGMEVATLVDDVLDPGRYVAQFDAHGLASGTYICRMIAGDFVQSMRMVLSK